MFKFLLQGLALARPYSFRLVVGIICGFLAGVANPLLMVSVRLTINTIFPTAESAAASGVLPANAVPSFLRGLIEWGNSFLNQPGGHATNVVLIVIIMMIPFSMFLRSGLGYVNVYLMNWVSMRVVMDLRVKMFRHVLSLGSSFFSRSSTGTIMSQLQAADSIQAALGNSWVTIIREPITVVSLIALLLVSHPRLTLLSVTVLPFTLVPYIIYSRRVRKSMKVLMQQMSDQGKLVHESLSGYRILKAYNLEKKATDEYERTARLGAAHGMRILRAGELPSAMMEFLGAIGVATFFIYIALFSPPGEMQPGDIMQFVGCIFLLYQPFKALIRLHNQLEQARVISGMVFSLLDTKNDVLEPENPKPLHAAGADVAFEHIKFNYGEKPVLHDFSLTVKAGHLVALVGSSGAGKTTVTNLLLRFHDPQNGRITIGGLDIRDVHTRDLRGQIAVVTQETVLFNDTIFNNIALGKPGATRDEVMEAAKHAHAHDFVLEKQEGYDTIIGEKGAMLSGGQRQRLAIARAIVKDAPILILDEATNSLDAESERTVQVALEELMVGRTTICIAHRLSTIQRANQIVVMEEGRIVETGTHAELLERGGVYRRLYDLQFAQ
ncbi:MAG: ABC transporter ATP-binding protein [Chthoniobacteraceae bacterium]